MIVLIGNNDLTIMDKDLSNLHLGENTKDIAQYLCIPMEHLKAMINQLENLSNDETEKEHIIDILKECLYYQKEINILISQINDSDYDKEELLNKLKSSVKSIFNIEEELISDYPELFSNQNGQWWVYNPQTSVSFDLNSKFKTSIGTKEKKKLKFKDIKFGLFFLLPAFLFIILYPWINKINKEEELSSRTIVYEDDRAYKNMFYIYSAVLSNTENENNFYSLIKSRSFRMPEGFVVIDKNIIVDYYLKEYYGLNGLENRPDITVISVNNLNYVQCKYIITKFSAIALPAILVNDNVLSFGNNFDIDKHCLSNISKGNIISLYVRK